MESGNKFKLSTTAVGNTNNMLVLVQYNFLCV